MRIAIVVGLALALVAVVASDGIIEFHDSFLPGLDRLLSPMAAA